MTGATVQPMALDVAPYDLAVLVKRAPAALVERLHHAHVPIVWDVVDGWPQPVGNEWNRDECLAWLRGMVKAVRPRAIVAATQAMATDCGEFGVPVLYLPHHARPGIEANPIRESVQTVGYEGSEAHLGAWKPWLEAECRRRGWAFVVNPARMADADIVVALRERTGYAPSTWKSNIKLANAMGSGTPFIGAREAGYIEQSCGVERFVETEDQVSKAFDALTPQKERLRCSGFMKAVAPRLEYVAATYRAWLVSLNA